MPPVINVILKTIAAGSQVLPLRQGAGYGGGKRSLYPLYVAGMHMCAQALGFIPGHKPAAVCIRNGIHFGNPAQRRFQYRFAIPNV